MEQSNALLQVSEIQLVYKPVIRPSQRLKVGQASDVYKILLDGWDKDSIHLVEQFKIVLLNKACKVLGVSTISTGGITGTIVDMKLVFGIALKGGASSIVLTHNHPSGGLIPSTQDRNLTRKIYEAGRILDIDVVDHLIISTEGYYSFAEEGIL
ncbi:JAB domain-containing protein [Pedobacter puniceum]|uniref:DNA repair protein n=1 Tax=Pedobacter puniceum TaxID=2666136 RepID=A0A7K0FLF1_9SPHI|nr:JAB domain-containing protein [Pedobacter puniceum]MRX46642.1 DNA repair protein [Pedobacter puniceum]